MNISGFNPALHAAFAFDSNVKKNAPDLLPDSAPHRVPSKFDVPFGGGPDLLPDSVSHRTPSKFDASFGAGPDLLPDSVPHQGIGKAKAFL